MRHLSVARLRLFLFRRCQEHKNPYKYHFVLFKILGANVLDVERGAPFACMIRFDPLGFKHGPYTFPRGNPIQNVPLILHFRLEDKVEDNVAKLPGLYSRKLQDIFNIS